MKAKLNPHKLRKKDLVWLHTHYCRHGHTYAEHYSCFLTEDPDTAPFHEHIGFFDIEASDLNAAFGYMISYCIKELDGQVLGRVLTPEEVLSGAFDKKLIKEAVTNLKKFDRVIVHWGKDRRYDLPFLRSRALKHKLDFPLYKEVLCQDTWDMCKAKLCLKSNGLKYVCKFLGIPAKGHGLIPEVWQLAGIGRQKELDYIFRHNKEDVVSTEALWKKLHEFVGQTRTSI